MGEVGKLAVVTGATGGIGRAIARVLSADGYGVLAQYATNVAGAEALRAEITGGGGACWLVRADLGSRGGVAGVVEAVDEVLAAHPGLRVGALVNNAGKLLGPGFFQATPEAFEEYFALNVKAPFFLAQQVAARMSSGGSIVNLSSAAAHFSSPGDIVYAMSKAALESLTKNAAQALASEGIRINTVVPGFTDNGHDAFKIPQLREHMSSFAVLGGISEPGTVADAVAFLVSDRAARTTGATLDVSGGSTLGARPSSGLHVKDLIADR